VERQLSGVLQHVFVHADLVLDLLGELGDLRHLVVDLLGRLADERH
jgi:hypothetical protein